jgi:HSP20 family protein
MSKPRGTAALGAILGNLGDLIRRLDEVGETLESREGTFTLDEEKGLKGVYGVNVKVGLGRDGQRDVKVEPFGNLKRDDTTGEATVSGVREPLVDVMEEADHVLVVAEMPGIEAGDVQVTVEGDILQLEAERGERHYRREVLLPGAVSADPPVIHVNNGLVEIRLPR